MIKSGTHDYLIILGILNVFCFLLPYQINYNCFFGKFIWVNTQICTLIKVMSVVEVEQVRGMPNEFFYDVFMIQSNKPINKQGYQIIGECRKPGLLYCEKGIFPLKGTFMFIHSQ